MATYKSAYSGPQIDEAIGKVLSNQMNGSSNRNLLDNWYFVGGGSQQGGGQFPINQRGQTVYSAGSYGIDRWVMYAPSGNLQSDGLHFSTNESIAQNLESSLINALNGKTVTMSVLTSDGLFAGSIVYDKTVAQYFYAQGITLVKGVDGNGSNYAQVFASSPTVVYAAKLELGDTQTLAHQENGVWVLNEIPNYAEELAKCQRFFYALTQISGTPLIGTGVARTSTDSTIMIPVPTTMRKATPTIAFSGGVKLWHGSTVGSSAPAVTSVQDANVSDNAIAVTVAVASGLTAGEVCHVQLRDSSAKITISCDL